MRYWCRGKRGGLAGFLMIALLVAGGLVFALVVTAVPSLRLKQVPGRDRAGES